METDSDVIESTPLDFTPVPLQQIPVYLIDISHNNKAMFGNMWGAMILKIIKGANK